MKLDIRAILNLYFDFYGLLLTEKQQQIFKLYYEDDLSLAEIAAETQVTRQAVHDILQRAEKQLQHYETKLSLVKKFLEQKEKITQAYELLQNSNNTENIEKACDILKSVILTEDISLPEIL